ncbi:hypothetical protein AB0I61_22730 [Polymorphospora rubra]|uniref:hypothetical protein n=1 Tax=Polymorphospora rubra TaxID=338584 RepID=UPI0033DDA9A2
MYTFWRARPAWTFDLVAEDVTARPREHVRTEALHACDRVRAQGGTPAVRGDGHGWAA